MFGPRSCQECCAETCSEVTCEANYAKKSELKASETDGIWKGKSPEAMGFYMFFTINIYDFPVRFHDFPIPWIPVSSRFSLMWLGRKKNSEKFPEEKKTADLRSYLGGLLGLATPTKFGWFLWFGRGSIPMNLFWITGYVPVLVSCHWCTGQGPPPWWSTEFLLWRDLCFAHLRQEHGTRWRSILDTANGRVMESIEGSIFEAVVPGWTLAPRGWRFLGICVAQCYSLGFQWGP